MTKSMFRHFAFIPTLSIVLLLASSTWAQDETLTTRRDPHDLARRLQGFDAEYALPMPSPLYSVGDTAEFWIPKTDSDTPSKIMAEAAVVTPNLYIWVEDGLEYNTQQMDGMAAQISNLIGALRYRSNYGRTTELPGVGEIPDFFSQMPLPDVDNDPRWFIVYTSNLGDIPAVYNFNDSLPVEIAPGGYSNQHETLFLNTSFYPELPLTDAVYANVIVRNFYLMLMDYNYPDQALWLKNALSWFVAQQLQVSAGLEDSMMAFLQAPDTNITGPSTLTNNAQVIGGQALLLSYFAQRYGANPFAELFVQSGEGLQPLDRTLAEFGINDHITDHPVTGLDVFADFVIANGVNVPFGDGRFVHTLVEFPQNTRATVQTISNPSNFALDDQTINQYGTLYLQMENPQPTTYTLTFDGNDLAQHLPMPLSNDDGNFFYWSGNGRNQDTRLTQAFDLRGINTATLNFDTWYNLANQWNYTYVEVSTDGGGTWDILPATTTTSQSYYGAAYGAGFTGISNTDEPRPFPTLGILLDSDGATVLDVVANGPSAQAGVRAGDVVIGYDETPWPGGRPDIFGLLAQYAAGDTLSLYIQRQGEQMSLPVILGAHPERVVNPESIWLAQEVDLSTYAGTEILLRFEYISLPGRDNPGFALDNITIPEINYRDNAETESGGWASNGWTRINNQQQQRFLVQIARSGTNTTPPSVRRLISTQDEMTEGQWQIGLDANEILIIAVSAVNSQTQQPAQFDLSVISSSNVNTF